MPLTPRQKETMMFAELTRCAALGLPCPTCDDWAMMLDTDAVSNTVQVMQRLERQGLIQVERFQRSRVVTIVATGQRTAEPSNKSPHWRERVRAMMQNHPDVMPA